MNSYFCAQKPNNHHDIHFYVHTEKWFSKMMQHNHCDQLVAQMSLLSFIDLFMLEVVDMVCEFSEGSF